MKPFHVLIITLLGVLCATSSFASLNAQLEPVSDSSAQIYKDEIAEFWVDITNTQTNSDKFLVYTLNPSWILYTQPEVVEVAPGATERFKLFADPTSVIQDSGLYSLGLVVQSRNTKDSVDLNSEILIKSETRREFQPAISVQTSIGENSVVDPRSPVDVQVRLINRNALDIPKLTVFVQSSHFETTYETALSPNSEIIRAFSFDIDPYIPPDTDTLRVKVFVGNEEVEDKRVEYTVQKNQLLFSRDTNTNSEFLFKEYTVKLENLGNVQSTEVFSYDVGGIENLFTETSPASAFVRTNESSKLEFDVTLAPSEVKTITITTDYRQTFYTLLSIVVAIIIVLILYYTLRSPIVVTKKASVVAERDGGTQEIKILVNIRNRTNKNLENISVVDRIPEITEIEKEFSIGTLKPNKIVRHPKKGTLIKWDFPSIEGFEERIITYKIHSKLGILGSFELPGSIVKFDLPNGKSRAVRSKSIEKS